MRLARRRTEVGDAEKDVEREEKEDGEGRGQVRERGRGVAADRAS